MTGALESSLDLGEPYHVGIAVRDLDDAMKRFAGTFGVRDWGTMDFDVPCLYRGAENTIGAHTAFARSGNLLIELVQPTSGRFTAQAFLEERGEGVYHLGYWVEDMTEALGRAADLGIAVDCAMPPTDTPFAVYLDAGPTLGIHIELVQSSIRPILDKVVADAKRR